MKMTGCPSVSVQYTLSIEANLREVYRVHWLQAKARKDRWNEEIMLLEAETGWTRAFFTLKADKWNALKKEGGENGDHRLACYAARQNDLYHKLADICS